MELTERIAEQVHKTWQGWSRYMTRNMGLGNLKRWMRQERTDYADLSEEEKNTDREIANKYLAIFHDAVLHMDLPDPDPHEYEGEWEAVIEGKEAARKAVLALCKPKEVKNAETD